MSNVPERDEPADGLFDQDLVVIACDESGSEGERLTNSTHDVFAHASVLISPTDAASVIADLREKSPSQATEFKSSQLLLRKNRSTLMWLLDRDGPLAGRGHVHLTEKTFFVVGKVIDLLIEELTFDAGIDLYAGGKAKAMADTLYREGARSFDHKSWQNFLAAFNSLMRAKDRRQVKVSVEEFFGMVDELRLRSRRRSVEYVMELLWRTRNQADQFQERLIDGNSTVPALDPLFAAIPLAASFWSEGKYRVGVVHDVQSALTTERLEPMISVLADPPSSMRKYWPKVKIEYVHQVDSRSDPRVQLADLLAGAARTIANDELLGKKDQVLSELLRPYVDEHSLWGDTASWQRISPEKPPRGRP